MTDQDLQDVLARLKVSDHTITDVRSVAGPGDVVVIDRIYRDWKRVRDLALEQTFKRDESDYPGTRAILRGHIPELDGVIGRLVSSQIVRPANQVVFSQLDAKGYLRPEQRVPHCDGGVEVSGVVYLNEPRAFGGGTAFFRHRPTGLFGIFPGEPEMELAARSSRHESVDAMLTSLRTLSPTDSIYGALPSETWDRVHLVTLRPNRLVLFDAHLFHAPLFDLKPARGVRLTQNIFLRVDPPNARVRFRGAVLRASKRRSRQ